MHYWNEARSIHTKNLPIDETENISRFGFHDIFNNSTKSYISITEKSVKGVIEMLKALGEIGAMTAG